MTSFVLLIAMAAAEPKKCSDLGQTYCQFLENNKDQPVIKGSDGSQMVNPAYYKNLPGAPTPREFASQANVRKLMTKLESPNVPLGLYMDLSSQLANISKPNVTKLRVVWPPDSDKPATFVPKQEIFEWLKGRIGSEKVDGFLNEVQRQSSNLEQPGAGDAFAAERELVQKILRDPTALAEKTRELEKIFEFARKSDIDLVTHGETDPNKWSDEQKNLVTRMKGVKPTFAFKEPLLSQHCESLENAQNSVADQTVYICPGLLLASPSRKAQVLGHEIGHNATPCAVQSEFATFNVPKTLEYAKAHFKPDNYATAQQWFNDGGGHYDHTFEGVMNEPNLFENLKSAGALNVEQPRFSEIPGTYRAAITCAEEEYHLRFDKAPERANQVRDWGDHLASFSQLAPEGRSSLLAHADHMNRKFSNCKVLPGPEGQIEEFSADMFGLVSKDRWATANPPKTEVDKMLSFNANRVCEFGNLLPTERLQDTAGLVATVSAAGERFRAPKDDSHPSDVKRMTLEADSPGLARLYDCERVGRHCFDALSDPKKYGQSANAEAGAHR